MAWATYRQRRRVRYRSPAKHIFTIFDTRGCSCEQIVAAEGLGGGHLMHGCSEGVMKNWIDDHDG